MGSVPFGLCRKNYWWGFMFTCLLFSCINNTNAWPTDFGCYQGLCWGGCFLGWCFTVDPKHPDDFAKCTTAADCSPEWLCPETESCWPSNTISANRLVTLKAMGSIPFGLCRKNYWWGFMFTCLLFSCINNTNAWPSSFGCDKGLCWGGCFVGWCHTVDPKHPEDFAKCTTDEDCNSEWLCTETESCWPSKPINVNSY